MARNPREEEDYQMSRKNSDQVHFFHGGMRIDNINNLEDAKTFFYGWNGRLYSYNGKLAFSSIEGTVEVFNDARILKYLGYTAFKDELILMVKVENTGDFGIDSGNSGPPDITYPSAGGGAPVNPAAVDFSDLYEIINDGFLGEICDNSSSPGTPGSNTVDAFLSIKKVGTTLVGKWLWIGDMNWSMTSKICTVGMYENNSFKRIYFTDYTNSFRVVNVLNGKIENLDSNQFNVFQEFSLSQPLPKKPVVGGSLKSGVNFYTYRLISNDGQRTVFSDLSERVIIHPGTTGQDIRGGDVSEDTGKKVEVKIINADTNVYDKIEVVAIVYEAEGSPTSIKSIGVQDLQTENIFFHTGTEAGFDLNITLADLTERNVGWRFCSDLRTKKNKLIAAGLRNVPLPNSLIDIEKDFILRAFNVGGSTYQTSFINPDPKTYRFIPKSGSIGSYKKKKTIINQIKVFGSFTFTLKYNLVEFSITIPQDNNYNDVTALLWDFIQQHTSSFPEFYFSFINQNIVMAPVNTSYDLDDLKFIFSTQEFTIDANYEYKFTNPNISVPLIHGFQSYGFEKGNGVRITFKPEFQDLMEKEGPFMSPKFNYTDVFKEFNGLWDLPNINITNQVLADSYSFNRQNLFNLKENNFKRGLFKGEIYRIGLQFEASGQTIFVTPIGDIFVPEIGDDVLTLENQEITQWGNSRTKDNLLQSILTNLLVDVRLNCDLKKIYTSVKLVYVQRTPENRTITCQGISAPLVRVNQFTGTSVQITPPIANKWTLPFNGGPTIDAAGLVDNDTYGENLNSIVGQRGRTIVNRKMAYFDSPEILFDRIPSEEIQNGKVQIVAKIWADHQGQKYAGHGYPFENQPTFSQKINSTIPVSSRNVKPGTLYPNSHGLIGDANTLPNWVNVSIFSEAQYIKNKSEVNIQKSKTMSKGEILNGSYLDSPFEISNNAMTLFQPIIYFSYMDRYPEVKKGNTNFEGWKSNRHSMGARTVFLKSQENIFPASFFQVFAPLLPEGVGGDESTGFGPMLQHVEHALVNIVKDNADSIYGGRTELAYSSNLFIPMSKTIAIPKDSNRTMRIQVQGDTYCSLFFNNKTQYADYPEERIHMNHAGGGSNGLDANKDYDDIPKRTGAWAYGVIVESSVDIALSKGLKFYQNSGAVDMGKTTENVNEVYFQEGTLKKYVSKPLDFKDDPDLLHVVAVSDTKIMGSPIDNWTSFKINNFYELEKDKGGVLNLGKSLDELYSIQESQTSRLLLNERNASVSSSDGNILFKTGDGQGIDGHQVISDYGTAIRRSVTEITSSAKGSAGFYFYDERKNELVKISEGILVKEDLAYYVNKMLENNPVYDVEGYYDDLNKETVIRTRTKEGQVLTYSYNELFGVMNGFYEYDNDQYFMWNNEIFTPKLDSSKIEQLNKGVHLRISNDDKSMKIGVTTNISPTSVKIFHNFMANINVDYPIERLIIKTSSGQEREIPGTHKRYKIREGVHSVPLKNDIDWSDLRGEWMELTIEIKNKKNKKIDIFSITNFVRQSYI